MAIIPPPPMPDLYSLWKDVQTGFESLLRNAGDALIEEEALSRWISVIQIMLKTDRRLLIQDGYPDRYDDLIETLCNAVKTEADSNSTYSDDEAMSGESDRFASISNDLDELIPYFSHLEGEIQAASRDAFLLSVRLREKASSSNESNQPSWASQRSTTTTPAIDLDRLFVDL